MQFSSALLPRGGQGTWGAGRLWSGVWGHGACASEPVRVFSRDQNQVRPSFAGDSTRFSWSERQAREVSEHLVDLFVGISRLLHKGRSGEAVWGFGWGFLGVAGSIGRWGGNHKMGVCQRWPWIVLSPQAEVGARKERRQGEKRQGPSPQLSVGGWRYPVPQRAPRGPTMGTERQAQGAWGPCGALVALPTGSFHLKERDTYLTLMEPPWALDPGNHSLRKVAERSSESHHSEGWAGQRTWSEIGANASEDHASSEKATEAPRLGRVSLGLLSKGRSVKPPQRG